MKLIGSSIGANVDFGAQDPCGPGATSIFMGHAAGGCREEIGVQERNCAAVQGILTHCAGLPIALAVTCCVVAAREFECDRYFRDLREKTNLGRQF